MGVPSERPGIKFWESGADVWAEAAVGGIVSQQVAFRAGPSAGITM